MQDERSVRLQEACKDAQMALLMDEYLEAEGEALWKEFEKAEDAGEILEPAPELNAACRRLIRNYRKPAPSKEEKLRPHRALRRVAAAAVGAVLAFTTLFTVQAAGVNVFGVLARWTESTFGYHVTGGAVDTETTVGAPFGKPKSEVQKALEKMGIPSGLAPTWVPEGYELLNIEYADTEAFKGVFPNYQNEAGEFIGLSVLEYFDPAALEATCVEKDPGDAETLVFNGHTFYLFTNMGGWTGVWSDGRYLICMGDFQSRDDLTTMITSIEEMPDENE